MAIQNGGNYGPANSYMTGDNFNRGQQIPDNGYNYDQFRPNVYQQNPQMPRAYFNRPPQPSVPGRVITSENEIAVNEVPMDGSVAIFPMQDMSCVIAKAWNSNGTIDTMKFVPEIRKENPENSDDPFKTEVMSRLGNIEKMLKSTRKRNYYRKENTNESND